MPPTKTQDTVTRRRPASLIEVARRSGFSTATVSRAFNNPEKVMPETRDAILKIADELKYRPNRLVGGVIRGQAPIIGILISNLNTSYIPQILGGVFETCEAHHFTCMVYDAATRIDQEVNALKLCVQHRLAGILYCPIVLPDEDRSAVLQEIDEIGIPVVYFDSKFSPDAPVPLVGNDDYQGAYDAVTHLIELGHRRILHLQGVENYYRTSVERRRGYEAALKTAGIKPDPNLIRTCGFDAGEKTHAILEELELPNGDRPYTAIFAASDYAAMASMQFFHRRGVNIPGDVSIIGYGDLEGSSLVYPPLTTVNQHFRDVGSQAAEVCLKYITNELRPADETLLIPTSLVLRESTAPPPAKT